MNLRHPRSKRTDTLCPTRRPSDLYETLRAQAGGDFADYGLAHPVDFSKLFPRRQFGADHISARLDSVLQALCHLVGERRHFRCHSWSILNECRSEAHTSELQSLMRISFAVFCLKKKNY